MKVEAVWSVENRQCAFIKREIRDWPFQNEGQQVLDTWAMRNWGPAQFLGREPVPAAWAREFAL